MRRNISAPAVTLAGIAVLWSAVGLTACRPSGRDYVPPVAPSTLSLDIPWCADIKATDVRACVQPVKGDEYRWRLYQAQPLDGSGKRGEPSIVNVCAETGTLPCVVLKDADAPRHAIRYVTVHYTPDNTPFKDMKD